MSTTETGFERNISYKKMSRSPNKQSPKKRGPKNAKSASKRLESEFHHKGGSSMANNQQSHQVAETAATVADKANGLYQDTQKMVGQVGQRILDTTEDFRAQVDEFRGDTTDWMKENPFKSAMIGFGAGCLAGLLIARPWRRD